MITKQNICQDEHEDSGTIERYIRAARRGIRFNMTDNEIIDAFREEGIDAGSAILAIAAAKILHKDV